MKKPNITPGEWTVSALPPADGKYIFQGTDVNPVCALAEWTEEGILQHDFFPENQEANARAISAVPDMIDALISNMELLEAVRLFLNSNRNYSDLDLSGITNSLKEMKQSLKKAGVTFEEE